MDKWKKKERKEEKRKRKRFLEEQAGVRPYRFIFRPFKGSKVFVTMTKALTCCRLSTAAARLVSNMKVKKMEVAKWW